MNQPEEVAPPHETGNRKKKRRKFGDRVEVDVGGRTFVTSLSTLTAASVYFRNKFADRWNDDGEDDDEEICCFVDQDPEPFAVLLAYMRSGMIHVNYISREVLAQAVYLGMDNLLFAVKVRTYRNLHPDDDSKNEQEASQAFDKEYGDVFAALTSGVLPDALTRLPEPKKEYATMKMMRVWPPWVAEVIVSPNGETNASIPPFGLSLIGALNKMSFYGFVEHEAHLLHCTPSYSTHTFSRRVPVTKKDESTNIFIDPGAWPTNQSTAKKSFAMMIDGVFEDTIWFAPKDFQGDGSERWSSKVSQVGMSWLVERSYLHREVDLERLVKAAYPTDPEAINPDLLSDFRIFSRPL